MNETTTGGRERRADVAHHPSAVATMEDPAEGLGEGIRRVDDAGDVRQNDVAGLDPFL